MVRILAVADGAIRMQGPELFPFRQLAVFDISPHLGSLLRGLDFNGYATHRRIPTHHP